jgi:hypothetical protein
MDIGDWQELARLRHENHAWHRCVAEIVDALYPPPGRSMQRGTLHDEIEQSIAVLNERLHRIGRRPVSAGR